MNEGMNEGMGNNSKTRKNILAGIMLALSLICSSGKEQQAFGQTANGALYTVKSDTAGNGYYREVLSQKEAQEILNHLQTLSQQYEHLTTQEERSFGEIIKSFNLEYPSFVDKSDELPSSSKIGQQVTLLSNQQNIEPSLREKKILANIIMINNIIAIYNVICNKQTGLQQIYNFRVHSETPEAMDAKLYFYMLGNVGVLLQEFKESIQKDYNGFAGQQTPSTSQGKGKDKQGNTHNTTSMSIYDRIGTAINRSN